MILERHYDDEALISLLEADRVDADAHLPTCRACSSKLESYRDLSSVLREADVWDTREWSTEPSASSISRIRAFATQMEDEDAQAEGYVAQLLAGSREEWMPRLQQHPEWRTAGVLRKLIAKTTPLVQTNPADGLAMAVLDTEIADHLSDTGKEAYTVAFLRGSAWRERAYALYYVGHFADALSACDRSEAELDHCVVDGYERARVRIARALTLRALENFGSAEACIDTSVETFVQFGDMSRLASARITQVHLLFSRGSHAEALAILEELEPRLAASSDVTNHALVLQNLGYCYWKLGRVADALRSHDAAAALLGHVGLRSQAVRVQWNVASILAGEGKVDEAERRFLVLKSEFDELSMTSEAALVRLDLAELLLAREQFSEIENLCREAMQTFERAGTSYGTRARTALSYLQEAARLRKATPIIVKHVREYIRRLPQDAELLFAPPPPQ